jgi:cephalosporin hydroxylase
MLDLKRIHIIRDSEFSLLKDISGLERIIFNLGLNIENQDELPLCIINNGGGLKIWQYPNQFTKYLITLSTLGPINSYIEIGCRWGGTFILTCEYLSRFFSLERCVAVDMIQSPVETYCDYNSICTFKQTDSHSEEFKIYMKDNKFDLIFIDGDHTYEGVKEDYTACINSGNIFVFHDIVNAKCEGVIKFWNELKNNSNDTYDFYEFIDQYDEVIQRSGNHFLGIGLAVKKVRV